METLRQWIQTLSLAVLAAGVLVLVSRPVPEALAAEPPECRLVDSGKFGWDKAGEDVIAQAVAFLASRGAREHVVVLPFGRSASGSGGTYSVMCLW